MSFSRNLDFRTGGSKVRAAPQDSFRIRPDYPMMKPFSHSGNPVRGGATLGRRGFLGAALAAAVLPAGRLRAETAAEAEAWPRRFTHAFGETVIEKPAVRVVSLGYTTQDTLLALGVVPLAVRYWYGDAPFGVWPWAADRLDGAEPVLLTGESGIETVAALQPDLIVGIGSGLGQAEYAVLSQIAPVLMHAPDAPVYGMPWPELTRTLARATGKEAEAEAAIAGVGAQFAAARARHPDWQGKTATAAYHFNGETGAYVAFDGRAQFLTGLGFSLSPLIAGYAGKDFYRPLSPEDLSALEADVLIWMTSTPNDPDLVALPMRRLLKAHIEGREVYASGAPSVALSFGSILSLPYALSALEADIAAAIDGDPATPVASAVAAGLAP